MPMGGFGAAVRAGRGHRFSGVLTHRHAFDVIKPIADIALEVSGLCERVGRETPTVIT